MFGIGIQRYAGVAVAAIIVVCVAVNAGRNEKSKNRLHWYRCELNWLYCMVMNKTDRVGASTVLCMTPASTWAG